ncbi:unnamed protein product [Durusdinium trenchii]|uniref:Ketosynthase family 3 (KS3) domain-containing protein n=1 Tax=Durusdinium trenchii TaxID=1381693 RepID=A0ABP0KBT3_9DINO
MLQVRIFHHSFAGLGCGLGFQHRLGGALEMGGRAERFPRELKSQRHDGANRAPLAQKLIQQSMKNRQAGLRAACALWRSSETLDLSQCFRNYCLLTKNQIHPTDVHSLPWRQKLISALPSFSTPPRRTGEHELRIRPSERTTRAPRSLVVPGAGKANFDSFEAKATPNSVPNTEVVPNWAVFGAELLRCFGRMNGRAGHGANPFETKSQRREREVQSLLEKLQPDSIMLNPDDIGQIDREVVKVWRDNSKKEEEAKAKEEAAKKKPVKKMRGKNKVGNRMKRKALKQGAEGRQKARNRLAGEKAEDAPRGATGRGFRRNEGDESDFHSPMNLEDAWADEAQRLLRQHRQNCDLEPLNIFAPRPRPVKRPFETLETAFQVTCQVMVALLSPRVHPWMRRLSACLRMQRTYPEVLPAPSLSVLVSGFHAKLVLDVANRLSLPPFRWAQYRPEPEDLLCPLTVHGLELNLLGAVAGVFIGRAAVEARQVLQGLACVAASMLPVSFQSMFLDRTVPFAAPCAALFFHMSSCAVLSPFVVSSMATLLQEAQLHRCLILPGPTVGGGPVNVGALAAQGPSQIPQEDGAEVDDDVPADLPTTREIVPASRSASPNPASSLATATLVELHGLPEEVLGKEREWCSTCQMGRSSLKHSEEFAPQHPERGGFHVAWPPEGNMEALAGFTATAVEALAKEGEDMTSEAAVEVKCGRFRWKRLRREFEPAYVGKHQKCKTAWLDEMVEEKPEMDTPIDPLDLYLARFTQFLLPVAPFALDFMPHSRTSGMLRIPATSDQLTVAETVSEEDIAKGLVDEHVDFLRLGADGASAISGIAAGTDGYVKAPIERFDIDQYTRTGDDWQIGWTYTIHGGYCKDIFSFDNDFFNVPEQEAWLLAPANKQLLERSYEALFNSGVSRKDVHGRRMGVYIGHSGDDWSVDPRFTSGGEDMHKFGYQARKWSCIAGRIAYILGLKGPQALLDTACSSALVAYGVGHTALRRSMLDQPMAGANSDISEALMGGANLIPGPGNYINLCGPHMLSVAGRCFTFDMSADGFERGEGSSCFFARSEESVPREALATVIGACLNQDGRTALAGSASMTAPNGPSQQECVRGSMREAGLTANQITCSELHGTGTALGDPIEVGALKGVMQDRKAPIMQTSAKSHIGHLEANAGQAGIIKCMLMCNSCAGTPNCHLYILNPHLDINGYPTVFNTELAEYGNQSGYSGVSSFGFGGANARADVFAIASRGPRKPGQVNLEKVDYVVVQCPIDEGPMHYIDGREVPTSGSRIFRNRGRYRCDNIRDEFDNYDYNSSLYEGKYQMSPPEEVALDRPDAGMCIVGSWDCFKSGTEMMSEGDSWSCLVQLGETRVERFHFSVLGDENSIIHPWVDRGSMMTRVVGPHADGKGKYWMIDGRDEEVPAGSVYRVTLHWGARLRVAWQREMSILSRGISTKELVGAEARHRYFVLGTWTSWTCFEMSPTEPNCFETTLRIGMSGMESFRFLRDQDPPDRNTAGGRESHGPHEGGHTV